MFGDFVEAMEIRLILGFDTKLMQNKEEKGTNP